MELDYITKIAQEPLYKYQYGADKLVESMSFHDVEHLVISMLIMHEASQDFYSSGEFFNKRVIELEIDKLTKKSFKSQLCQPSARIVNC